MRSIHVIATRNDQRKTERTMIRFGKKLGCGFGSSIRVGGFQDHLFVSAFFSFSIDFVGTDVKKSLNVCVFCSFKQSMSTKNISLGESSGITKRVVDVGLGGKVHDGIDGLFGKNKPD